MNQLEMIKNLMRGGLTPKGIAMQMLNNNSNPMLKNLVEMAEKGQIEDLKKFGRNLYKEYGMDFDKEFDNFTNKIKNGDIF